MLKSQAWCPWNSYIFDCLGKKSSLATARPLTSNAARLARCKGTRSKMRQNRWKQILFPLDWLVSHWDSKSWQSRQRIESKEKHFRRLYYFKKEGWGLWKGILRRKNSNSIGTYMRKMDIQRGNHLSQSERGAVSYWIIHQDTHCIKHYSQKTPDP